MRRNGHPPRPLSSKSSNPLPHPSSHPSSSSYSSSYDQRYRHLNSNDSRYCEDDIDDDESSHGGDVDGDDDDDYFLDLDDDEIDSFGRNKYFDQALPPPLPLCDIGPDETSNPSPKTILGCSIRTIPHIKNSIREGCKLYDPLLSRYYADWLTYRETKEKQLREQSGRNEIELNSSILVYKDVPFLNRDSDPSDSGNCSEDVGSDAVEKLPPNESNGLPSDTCRFDAEFESGNLELATRIFDREFVSSATNTATETELNYPSEMLVDQEYDLTLRNDLHTKGNIQWYYFSITSPSPSPSSGTSTTASSASPIPSPSPSPSPSPASSSQVKYPFRIRLNLVNMMKSDALYNYGMKPVIYSDYAAKLERIGWRHWNTEQICYYKNTRSYLHTKKNQKVKRKKATFTSANSSSSAPSSSASASSSSCYYTLSFVYTFHREDTVYFAHSIPYTYSHLQQYLYDLELKYSQFNSIFKRKLLCHSLCHNRCDILTITSVSSNPTSSSSVGSGPGLAYGGGSGGGSRIGRGSISSSSASSPSSPLTKSIILITARIHPGETNSSHVMENIITYLLSEEEEAKQLRNHYIFKIIPMLNPDGVIHGNYRCSLAGVDLNRKYLDPDPYGLYPIISAVKDLIKQYKGNINGEDNGNGSRGNGNGSRGNCSSSGGTSGVSNDFSSSSFSSSSASSSSHRRGISFYLDLHGHSQKKNVFFYGCDVSKANQKNIISSLHQLTLHQFVDRSLFTRIYPHIVTRVSHLRSATQQPHTATQTPTQTHSNGGGSGSGGGSGGGSGSGGYFSMKDSSFKVQKSKAGTGRVVCWNQFGILSAYTIEISFCGNGNNKEFTALKLLTAYHKKRQKERATTTSPPPPATAASTSVPSTSSNEMSFTTETAVAGGVGGVTLFPPESYQKYLDERYLRTELILSSSSSSSSSAPSLSSSDQKLLQAARDLKEILSSYDTLTHYNEFDYQHIAHDILLGIYSCSNLQLTDSSPSPSSSSLSSSRATATAVFCNANNRSNSIHHRAQESSPLLPTYLSSSRPSSACSPLRSPVSTSPSPASSSSLASLSPSFLPQSLGSTRDDSLASAAPIEMFSMSSSPSPLSSSQQLQRLQQLRQQQQQHKVQHLLLPCWDLIEIQSLPELTLPITHPAVITREVLTQLKQRIQQLSRKTYDEVILPNHRLGVEMELRETLRLKYDHNASSSVPLPSVPSSANAIVNVSAATTGSTSVSMGGAVCGVAVCPPQPLSKPQRGELRAENTMGDNFNDLKKIRIFFRSSFPADELSHTATALPTNTSHDLKKDGRVAEGGEEEGEEEEDDEEDCGSDSDPSGDELPSTTLLLQNKSFQFLVKENQPQILHNMKAMITSRLKNKKKRRKKKSDDLQRSADGGSGGSTSGGVSNRRNTAPHRQAINFANTFLGSSYSNSNSANSSPVISHRKKMTGIGTGIGTGGGEGQQQQQKKTRATVRIRNFVIDSAVNHKPDNTSYPKRLQQPSSQPLPLQPQPPSDSGNMPRQRPLSSHSHGTGGGGGGRSLSGASSNGNGNGGGVMSLSPSSPSLFSEMMDTRKMRSHVPLTVKDMTLLRDATPSPSGASAPASASYSYRPSLQQISTSPIAVQKPPNTREILTSCPHLKSNLATRAGGYGNASGSSSSQRER